MIPEKYRIVLPPYWYENQVAVHHFEAGEAERAYQQTRKLDLERQTMITTVTWGLPYWEYMFQVTPKQGDSYETRRARVMAKYRERLPFTPALASSITKLFIKEQAAYQVLIEENPDTGYFYISVPLWSIYDVASWVYDIHKRKRVPHVFMPQLAVSDGIVFSESITIKQRRYHRVHEFRAGMTPLKDQDEVMI
ncbi:putative phage tail protein [Brevibacillus laterosporus]|uniref:putative phage tail protein n=1 Tax=Brevibacillus laterosporus TaxID=1465 RepID=UPI003D1C26B0